jgi:hypothetical protein
MYSNLKIVLPKMSSPLTTISNGTSDGSDLLHSNESTLLTTVHSSTSASSDEEQLLLLTPSDRADSTESRPDADADLWREMDAPWPATFERTISLLASPIIHADRVNEMTKSPKPGNTPVALRRIMVCTI